MSSVSSLCLCWTLSLCLLVSVSAEPVNIPVKPGQSVSLPCRAPSNTDIVAVKWTKPGLEQESVFFYRDGRPDLDDQHPSYQNRVELQDGEMKDGDVTLILKNVTRDDAGTYKCRVAQRNHKTRATLKTIKTVHLQVQSGDKEGKSSGRNRYAAVVGVLLFIAAVAGVGAAYYHQNKGATDQSSPQKSHSE